MSGSNENQHEAFTDDVLRASTRVPQRRQLFLGGLTPDGEHNTDRADWWIDGIGHRKKVWPRPLRAAMQSGPRKAYAASSPGTERSRRHPAV